MTIVITIHSNGNLENTEKYFPFNYIYIFVTNMLLGLQKYYFFNKG